MIFSPKALKLPSPLHNLKFFPKGFDKLPPPQGWGMRNFIHTWLQDLHEGGEVQGPPAPTSPLINKYIYSLLRTEYVSNGCKNLKVIFFILYLIIPLSSPHPSSSIKKIQNVDVSGRENSPSLSPTALKMRSEKGKKQGGYLFLMVFFVVFLERKKYLLEFF